AERPATAATAPVTQTKRPPIGSRANAMPASGRTMSQVTENDCPASAAAPVITAAEPVIMVPPPATTGRACLGEINVNAADSAPTTTDAHSAMAAVFNGRSAFADPRQYLRVAAGIPRSRRPPAGYRPPCPQPRMRRQKLRR